MQPRTLALAAGLALTALTPAAAAQTAPWAPVPAAHTGPQSPRPATDPESVPLAHRPMGAMPAEAPPVVRPLSAALVTTQLVTGFGGGAVGALLGGMLALPAFIDNADAVGYAMILGGASIAAATTIWSIGHHHQSDGSFAHTLIGTSSGTLVGWALQYGLGAGRDQGGLALLGIGVLTTVGGVIGYGLSASSESQIAARNRSAINFRPPVTPSLALGRDGVVLGASGSF